MRSLEGVLLVAKGWLEMADSARIEQMVVQSGLDIYEGYS